MNNILVKDRPESKGPYSRQELFNNAWFWAVTKKMPPSSVGTVCEYRSKDNSNACLVGISIPDSHMPNVLEGLDIHSMVKGNICNINKYIRPEDCLFVAKLQSAHDFCSDSENYSNLIAAKLEQIAIKFELEIPVK